MHLQFQSSANNHPMTYPPTNAAIINIIAFVQLNASIENVKLKKCNGNTQSSAFCATPMPTSKAHSACHIATKSPKVKPSLFALILSTIFL